MSRNRGGVERREEKRRVRKRYESQLNGFAINVRVGRDASVNRLTRALAAKEKCEIHVLSRFSEDVVRPRLSASLKQHRENQLVRAMIRLRSRSRAFFSFCADFIANPIRLTKDCFATVRFRVRRETDGRKEEGFRKRGEGIEIEETINIFQAKQRRKRCIFFHKQPESL